MTNAQGLIEPRRTADTDATPRRAFALMRRWWLPTAIVSLLGGFVTLALWVSQATLGAVVTTGSFHFDLGEFSWVSRTQGVSSATNSTNRLTLGDGDELVVTQKIIGTFEGDNLNVKISLGWPGVPADWVATWFIADATGQTIAPAAGGDVPLATELVAPGLVVPGPATWQIVVTLKPANATVYGNPASPPHPSPFQLGPITITADQVRGQTS